MGLRSKLRSVSKLSVPLSQSTVFPKSTALPHSTTLITCITKSIIAPRNLMMSMPGSFPDEQTTHVASSRQSTPNSARACHDTAVPDNIMSVFPSSTPNSSKRGPTTHDKSRNSRLPSILKPKATLWRPPRNGSFREGTKKCDQLPSRANWKRVGWRRSTAERDKILSELDPTAAEAPSWNDSEDPEERQDFQKDIEEGEDKVKTQEDVDEEERLQRLEDFSLRLARKRSVPAPVSSFQKRELSLRYSRGLWGGDELRSHR